MPQLQNDPTEPFEKLLNELQRISSSIDHASRAIETRSRRNWWENWLKPKTIDWVKWAAVAAIVATIASVVSAVAAVASAIFSYKGLK